MLAELKTENQQRKKDGRPLIRYVIVYMMSRAFRNALEELATKAQLAKMGVTLISAKENFGDGYLGDAMQGIMAIFNELQVRSNGEDVKTKMANKARNGGTVGRAPLDYLNVGDVSQGREFRTVVVDPERGSLVRQAFELYATGDYTLADLSDELYDRGLRSRPRNGPAQQISVNKLSQMLRDRYYLGVVTFKGAEYQGRHEPLISHELFERVQDIIEARAAAMERRRVHHHYLKGSLFCGACKAGGITQRMIMQQTVNRYRNVYMYFFCRGRQNGTCTTPHIHVGRLEEAVEEHYATIRFSPEFLTEVRTHLAKAIDDENAAARLLHDQLTAELKTLDSKEENLLDLAADEEMPKAKIKSRLREIERRRQHLTERLGQTSEDLVEAAQLIERALTLLEDPQALYLRCDDDQRRMLNQAIFHALYVEEDKITGYELKEPFARLHALQAGQQAAAQSTPATAQDEGTTAGTGASAPQNANRTPPLSGKDPVGTFDVLLEGIRSVTGSSRTSMAPPTGLEPVTCRLTAGRSAD
jgi:site-specific DNA recombinase